MFVFDFQLIEPDSKAVIANHHFLSKQSTVNPLQLTQNLFMLKTMVGILHLFFNEERITYKAPHFFCSSFCKL